MLNVGLVGCGLIGEKRARAIIKNSNLIACFDTDKVKAKIFAHKFNCKSLDTLDELIQSNEIQVVFVASRHDSLAEISEKAISAGHHVFIEKPAALNTKNFSLVLEAKKKFKKSKIHIGYNHRYHPAIKHALTLCKDGEIGEMMLLRARYGHGGRLGYEKEWRANKQLSGGGELIDQGSHLLDLSIGFLGDIRLDYSATPNYYWPMNVEDNAFISIKNAKGNIGFLHASCTEWKNMFSLEVYGELGKLEVSGLGGSYGQEKIAIHRMMPEMGPPLTETFEYPGNDLSWEMEINDFFSDIKNDTNHTDNLETSRKILEIIDEIYEKTGR
jgi:predicted dehydrogenase